MVINAYAKAYVEVLEIISDFSKKNSKKFQKKEQNFMKKTKTQITNLK